METITFRDFVKSNNNINFDIVMHDMVLKLLKDNDTGEVELNKFTLFFFENKFYSLNKVKKLFKKYKFQIKKQQFYSEELDNKSFLVKKKDLLYLLLIYGSQKYKLYLNSLPFCIGEFQNYLEDLKFNVKKY